MSQHHDFASLAREMRGRSPLKGSILLLLILACLISAGLWAYLTELDDVTRVDGRVVPLADVQLIEATETGVLQHLHVNEGQFVEKGALLMEFDTTQIDSQFSQEQQRAFGLMARAERLMAEIEDRELFFSKELMEGAPDVVRSETALYQGRQSELIAEIAILERQREQKQREYEEGLVDKLTADETLKILAEERAIMTPLVEKRMEPATTLLTLRRNEAEWHGRRTRAQAVTNRLQTGLAEIDDRIRATRSRFHTAALTDLAVTTAELAALKPVLPALQDRASRAQVRSPVRGVVNRIHRTTIGGLARSGEELIELVPLGDNLLVEAYVRPDDIAFLHAGQPVKVKITAYDFARYGALDGEIVRIGANTITRSERNDEEVFVVEIQTKQSFLDANGVAVEIIPGMIAEVDILAGRKTVMEYLIRPVVKVKEQALRE
ncbi:MULTISPECIES: HlyD family type I secretion periplasmic adaptor subunit [unclassified Ruegeria]|uniref:HlyD family type I secretion periplasmic adaptor subunit n=1 Tax=unclassified Ruegeria TaxID=2625375 RepID=UPI001ADB7B24|nr:MULTISPECIES: HlyD family type I secretion periplasmic adaptor subunit [unclassified Ruegeria]MBO9412561.1 HlyD family type I secretion periplasmic adaptor subunit [Ruegeria sp. R8_1]MBO9416201.1 HlyD family type I secretion periplasmic adaptor subunit [Ruegeria sp. R8_2]